MTSAANTLPRGRPEERPRRISGMVSVWKKKKGKTSKIVVVVSNNWKEREWKLTAWNGSTRKNGEDSKIKSLGTEISGNTAYK